MAKGFDETKHPRAPKGAPEGAGGEFTSRALGAVGSAFKGIKKAVGLYKPPRSHKAGASGRTQRGRPSYGELAAKAALKNAAKKTGIGFARHAGHGLIGAAVNKLGGDYAHTRRRTTTGGHGVLAGLESGLLGFEHPRKIPASLSTTDDKTYKVALQFGHVTKKKRPTFPNGYKKHY